MRKFGLIGEHLPHSFSGRYFSAKFAAEGIDNCQYSLYELANIEAVEPLLNQLEGFNVTIPYKKQIIPYLTQLSPEAAAVGAVNCVKISGDKLIGYNTDIIGFRESLCTFLGEAKPTKALILGSGGASLAVKYILSEMGIEYKVVSRTPQDESQISYEQITPSTIESHRLIINATPLGTFPNVDTRPEIPYASLTPDHYLFDLVYNPSVTCFLASGAEYGAHTCNGEAMLIGQAEAAWSIWSD